MYIATMEYAVKEENREEFTRLWRENIFDLAQDQPGFIRMQLLVRESEALALGCWREKKNAEDFMKLGVFKKLMEAGRSLLREDPHPRLWNSMLDSSSDG